MAAQSSKNKPKTPFGGGVAQMDLSSVATINNREQPTVPVATEPESRTKEEKTKTSRDLPRSKAKDEKVKEQTLQTFNIPGTKGLKKSKRQRIIEQRQNSDSEKKGPVKQINFNTDSEMVALFKNLSLKYYLQNLPDSNKINYSEMFTRVLKSMLSAYPDLLLATERDLAFYKSTNTKGYDHQDLDIIGTKAKLAATLQEEDADNFYHLMHTYYTHLEVKPTRYSVNFFFFPFVRFFEKNFKNI